VVVVVVAVGIFGALARRDDGGVLAGGQLPLLGEATVVVVVGRLLATQLLGDGREIPRREVPLLGQAVVGVERGIAEADLGAVVEAEIERREGGDERRRCRRRALGRNRGAARGRWGRCGEIGEGRGLFRLGDRRSRRT